MHIIPISQKFQNSKFIALLEQAMNAKLSIKVPNITNEGNNNKILQNSMYEQEYNMVFTESALWAGLVVDSPCPSFLCL